MYPLAKTIQFFIMHLYKMDADAVNSSSLPLSLFLSVSDSSVGFGVFGGSVGFGVTGGSVGLGVSIGAG